MREEHLESETHFAMLCHADLLAALYNGPRVRTDEQAWTREDFYDPKAKTPSVKEKTFEEKVQDEIERWGVMLDNAARCGNADMAHEVN